MVKGKETNMHYDPPSIFATKKHADAHIEMHENPDLYAAEECPECGFWHALTTDDSAVEDADLDAPIGSEQGRIEYLEDLILSWAGAMSTDCKFKCRCGQKCEHESGCMDNCACVDITAASDDLFGEAVEISDRP